MEHQITIELPGTFDPDPAVHVVPAGREWLWIVRTTGELISRFDMTVSEYDEAYGAPEPQPQTLWSRFCAGLRVVLEELS